MPETRRFLDPEQRTGLNVYAKLFGSVTTPHNVATISRSEIGNGYYDFDLLDETLRYTVQEEVLPGVRAATDPILATLTPSVPSAVAISAVVNASTIGDNAAAAATQATLAATRTTPAAIKAGARLALDGRWQNHATNVPDGWDDVSVADRP